MASAASYIGSIKTKLTQLLPGHAYRGVLLFQAGASGSRINSAGWAAPTQGASQTNMKLFVARQMTKQENMGVGAFVDGGGGSDTITRTVGSFITDGFVVGNFFLVSGSTTLANDFGPIILTAVAAGTLTFETGTVSVAENMIAGGRLWLPIALGTIPSNIPMGGVASNNSAYYPSKNLLDPTYIPFVQSETNGEKYIMLGPNDALFGSLGAAVAGPTTEDVYVSGGDY